MNARAGSAVLPHRLRRALLLLALFAIAPVVRAADTAAAEPARLAPRSLLIAIATAGERLVAVGDRGIIVFSQDRGASWTQASLVPTQALLTGVCFFDAQHGIAVGHDLVVLTTADAGRSWTRTHYAPEAQRPLLDVWCGSGGRAIAVGAYSSLLTSADSGASWSEQKFSAAAPAKPWGGKPAAAPGGPGDTDSGGNAFHLNRIVAAGATRLYIAAEAGHLYRSDDAGASWQQLASPYEGSFFGVLPLEADVLLAFGLRGSLYRSADAGGSWRRLDSGTLAMLDGGAPLEGQGVAIVGLSGVVLVSRDGGRSFALQQEPDHAGISAAVALGREELATVGEYGVKVIDLAHAGAAGKGTP